MTREFEEFERHIKNRHQVAKEWKEKNNKKVFGYFCCVTPEEIIYAADILPVRITGSSDELEVVDSHIPSYGCPFVRSCIDLGARGVYDYLDRVVVPNTCDLVMRTEYWWRELIPRKVPTIAGLEICPYVLYIKYPEKITGRKVLQYLTMDFRLFKQYLERLQRMLLTDELLGKAIEVYNEHYRLMEELDELRKQNPPLVSGYEAWAVEFASLLMPKDEHNELMKSFLRAIPKRQEKPKDGVRLFLSSSAMDQETARLLKIIEECGGQVVSEDVSVGSSHYGTQLETGIAPLEAIAKRSLSVPCPRSTVTERLPEHRFAYISRRIEGYNIKGVIFYNLNYCECRALENPHLRDRLRDEFNLPVLFLEGDYTAEGLEQMRGRIEAFVELLGG